MFLEFLGYLIETRNEKSLNDLDSLADENDQENERVKKAISVVHAVLVKLDQEKVEVLKEELKSIKDELKRLTAASQVVSAAGVVLDLDLDMSSKEDY